MANKIEKMIYSSYQGSKSNKPNPYDLINEIPDNNLRENGIAFLDYLKQLRMNPSWYTSNCFNLNHKGKRVGTLRINYGLDRDRFNIQISCCFPAEHLFDMLMSEQTNEIKQMVLLKMSRCRSCQSCSPGVSRPVLGDEATNLCIHSGIHFYNPNEQQYELIKKLIEIRRESIKNNLL